jgi:isopenicillin N synthase-like dioxygenase
VTLTADIAPIPLTLVEADPAAASAALGDAFGLTGFAVVSDHGIPPDLIDRALTATKALFALPEAVKRRYLIPGGGGQRGLTPFGIETAKGAKTSDLKEFWHVGRDLLPGDPLRAAMPDNVWPDEVPGFHAAVAALYTGPACARSPPRAGGGLLRIPDPRRQFDPAAAPLSPGDRHACRRPGGGA